MGLIPSDPQQKAKFEQRAVMALLAIFTLTFLLGPMKSMQIGKSTPKVSTKTQTADARVDMSRSLSETVQAYEQRMDPENQMKALEQASPPASPSTPNYTAIELRNPLESLLPKASPPAPVRTVEVTPPAQPPKPKITPPSNVKIEGLIWGSLRPQAIINGQVYNVGDQMAGGKITAITRRGVSMDFDGTTVEFTTAAEATTQSLSRSARWR